MVKKIVSVFFVFLCALLIFYALQNRYGHILANLLSDSDLLAIPNFVHDFVNAIPVGGWQFPRSLFLFPDVLIVGIVFLLVGWSSLTLPLIGIINYSILIAVFYFIAKNTKDITHASLVRTATLVTFALLLIVFSMGSFSIGALYFQLFGSAVHAEVCLLTLFMLRLNKIMIAPSKKVWKYILLSIFTMLLVISDEMVFFILMCWMVSELLFCVRNRLPLKSRLDIGVIVLSSLIAHPLRHYVPHALWISACPISHFSDVIHVLRSFFSWMCSSYLKVTFILAMIVSALALPFVTRSRYDDLTLPALGMIVLTTGFWASSDSLRYMIFPALVLLLFMTLLGFRLLSWVSYKKQRIIFSILECLLLVILGGTIYHDARSPSSYVLPAVDGYRCVKAAAAIYPLDDGIATYANARPLMMYSNFTYYLAQVNPSAMQDGYYYWENNWRDFLYKDLTTKTPRHYNYIIAAHAELQTPSIWGDVIHHASHQYVCQHYTVFYFDHEAPLTAFLFPKGPPSEARLYGGYQHQTGLVSATHQAIRRLATFFF